MRLFLDLLALAFTIIFGISVIALIARIIYSVFFNTKSGGSLVIDIINFFKILKKH